MTQDAVFRTLGTLFRQVRSAQFTETFESLVIDLFQPQSVIVLVFENRRRPLLVSQWIPDAELQNVFERSYFDHGYFLDPYYELATSDLPDGTYKLRDIAPDRFFRCEYYRRYYRQTRMIDEIGCLERMDGHRVAHLSVGRNEGSAKFKRKDLSLLSALSQVLMPLIIEYCNYSIDSGSIKQPERSQRVLSEQLFYTKLSGRKRITLRESEIASLIVQGHSTSAIGLILEISPQTVKVHRRNIYRKLNISSQTELYTQFLT